MNTALLLIGFAYEGMHITNPFADETGRDTVSPNYYGFTIMDTGSRCEAWVKDVEDGCQIWLTDTSGMALPDDTEVRMGEVIIALRDPNGEEIKTNLLSDVYDQSAPEEPEEKFDYGYWRLQLQCWQRGETNFTSRLFDLICKADLGNRALIAKGFPDAVKAHKLWDTGGIKL